MADIQIVPMAESVKREITLPLEKGDLSTSQNMLAKESQSVEAFKDVIFGSIAGIIGKTIEYPFDTIKVRLQSQPETLPLRYTGPSDCFRQSLGEEGLRGLYRGVSAPLFGAAIETSSLFFSYRLAQTALRATTYSSEEFNTGLPLRALIACGAMSGAFTSLLLTPIELVKCQMQIPLSTNSYRGANAASIIASVYRKHGILGFWHGQLGTLIRETGGSAAWFGTYESVTLFFRRHFSSSSTHMLSTDTSAVPLPVWQQMIAGAVAGVSYNFVFYPADTIKSRMQTEEVSDISKGQRKAFWAVGKALWAQQGIRGLYRGCGITVARAAPSSAIIFAIYEGLRNRVP
ncbi:hypothetical protein MMC19_002957 [Ptychographa xylographoides]|nr:hypothetical protein [Ptychographa xylographoides]